MKITTETALDLLDYDSICSVIIASYPIANELNVKTTIYLGDDGIHEILRGKENSQLDTLYYKFKNFKITARYMKPGNSQEYYNGAITYKGSPHLFNNISDSELSRYICEKCIQGSSKPGYVMGILQTYITKTKIPEIETVDIIGFNPYKDEWTLTHMQKYYFPRKISIRKRFAERVKRIFSKSSVKKFNLETFPERFKAFYDGTSLGFKEYIFNFIIMAPFMFALKDIIDLQPFLALMGPNQKGKTAIVRELIRMYTSEKKVYTSDNFNSYARAPAYLSQSTLPICIDDCQGLNKKSVDLIKDHLTGIVENEKLNVKHESDVLCKLVAALVFTFNTFPILFNDTAFLTRGITLNIKNITMNKKEWKKLSRDILDGELLYYMTEITKDMKVYQILDLMDEYEFEDLSGRNETIMKLLSVGQFWMKEWFEIESPMVGYKEILDASKIGGNDGVTEYVYDWFTIAGSYETVTYKHNTGRYITSTCLAQIRAGLGYHTDHLKSLKSLESLLQVEYPNVKKIAKRLNSEQVKGVFFPDAYFNTKVKWVDPNE